MFVQLSPQFDKLYARMGRPSIAPEKLLRALLLQVLYSVGSERLLMEELNYNMLFRWFVGLNMDDRVWDATTFTKNRERLLRGDIAEEFFAGVLDQARGHELLSDEHFTVDGTLLEAAASLKSFKSKDQQDEPPADDPGNPTVKFHGHSLVGAVDCDCCRGRVRAAGRGVAGERAFRIVIGNCFDSGAVFHEFSQVPKLEIARNALADERAD